MILKEVAEETKEQKTLRMRMQLALSKQQQQIDQQNDAIKKMDRQIATLNGTIATLIRKLGPGGR